MILGRAGRFELSQGVKLFQEWRLFLFVEEEKFKCFRILLFVGPFVFFRPAGREGALRQFDRRKVSNPPAAPSTAAARQ